MWKETDKNMANEEEDPVLDLPNDDAKRRDICDNVRLTDHCDQLLNGCYLFSWGCGEFGQNGHGHTSDLAFTRAKLDGFRDKGVKLVACGASHTVAVTDSNEIYAWGNGNSGQLGCGDKDKRNVPTRVQICSIQENGAAVQGLACGGRHTFIWLENGHMYSFGNNFFAQLGYDFRIQNYKDNQPHLLRTLTHRHVTQVACGEKHSLLLFVEGAVAVLGNGSHGQVGDGNTQDAVVPKFVEDLPKVKVIGAGSNHNLAVSVSGELYAWGYGKGCGSRNQDVLFPRRIPTRHSNVTQVAGGQAHSLVLTESGHVYSFGWGVEGQLGHGVKIKFLCSSQRIRTMEANEVFANIACGESYSSAISADGRLYLWGKNSHVIHADEPAGVKVFHPLCLNPDGPPVRTVSCGSWHAAAIVGLPRVSNEKSCTEFSDSELSEEEELSIEESSSVDNGSLASVGNDSRNPLPRPARREKTTLGEFYAPTPSPCFDTGYRSSPDVLDDHPGDLPPKQFLPGLSPPSTINNEGVKNAGALSRQSSARSTSSTGSVQTTLTQSSDALSRPGLDLPNNELGGIAFDDPHMAEVVKSSGTGDLGTNSGGCAFTINMETPLHPGVSKRNVNSYLKAKTGSNSPPINTIAGEYISNAGGSDAGSVSSAQLPKTTSSQFKISREKSVLTSKHLDFIPSDPPPSRFVIDKHISLKVAANDRPKQDNPGSEVPGGLARGSSGPGFGTRRGKSSQTSAPMVALRRSQTMSTLQVQSQTHSPSHKHSREGMPRSMGDAVSQEGSPAARRDNTTTGPSTVDLLTDSPDPLPRPGSRKVLGSIPPTRRLVRGKPKPVEDVLRHGPRGGRPMFSSASSWRSDVERNHMKSVLTPVSGIGKNGDGIIHSTSLPIESEKPSLKRPVGSGKFKSHNRSKPPAWEGM